MKHKSLFFIFTLIAILLSTSFVSVAQVGIIGTVEIELTLRTGPGTEWRILNRMPAGTNVALDGRDGSGAWVRGINQNSEVGWMAARYLTVTNDAVDRLFIA